MIANTTIRPFVPTPAEYEAIVHVFNRANPHDHHSAATWQHWDQHRAPDRQFTRHVLERAGEIGGYGFTVRTDPAANKFRFACYLLPAWQSAPTIHAFYSYLMAHCLEGKPTALICQTRDDEAEKIAWLGAHGFSQALRYPRSILDVTTFDARPFAGLKRKMADQGVTIASLAELVDRDPAWRRKVYELDMLLNEDVPRPTAFNPPPFAQYVERELEGPDFLAQGWLVARVGDDFVGLTSLYKTGADFETLETGLTGVRRDYRRRGLATVLKCYAIEMSQNLGTGRILTSNEEKNPMFQLNLQLGFEPLPADIDWEKKDP